MTEFDTPIFKKSYELYKTFCSFRTTIPKQDRHTSCEKTENIMLDLLEGILLASQTGKVEKVPILERASVKLNMLRVFIRLMKDTKAIDNKKYTLLQGHIDEIGRMLGGWIRSSKAETST